MTEKVLNIFGEEMEACCFDPLTGWKRDGYCNTDDFDHGSHVVCCEVTDAFLAFSKERGNDLSTPRPEFNFPGLKEGDRWCLCAMRWQEASRTCLHVERDPCCWTPAPRSRRRRVSRS